MINSTAYPPPAPRILRPYLGPLAHLSLSWLSQPLLSLLLLSITLSLLLNNIHHLVLDSKETFVASCQSVEGAAGVIVNLPHYTADGINEGNRKSVEFVMQGTRNVLDLSLVSIQEIAIFMIDMYRSLFLCLFELVVHGSLDILIGATEEAETFIKSAFQEVRKELQAAIHTVNSGLDETVKLLNDIPGVKIKPPQASIPALNSLENVHLPSSILSSLKTLNASIPTLQSLRDSLDVIITKPIIALRAEINSTFANNTISFQTLPVPPKTSISLCSNLDMSFIDNAGRGLGKFVKMALLLLALIAFLLIILGIYWEKYRYTSYLASIARAKEAWSIDMGDKFTRDEALSTPNLLAFLQASQHPRLSLWLAKISRWAGLSKEHRTSLYWFGSYIAHPSGMIFLVLGVVGLIVVEIELGLVEGPVRKMVQGQANQGAGDFSKQVEVALNARMNGTSSDYARESNKIIMGVQEGINKDLFGWVNVTTTTMNSTLNAFYDGLTGAVTTALGKTPLANPALGLVNCLIGSKIRGIESALTFIHDHAHVNLPPVSPTVLLLSPTRITELTSGLTSPNSTLSSTSIVNRMVDRYAETLRQQRGGFIVCIAIWGFVVLMGLMGVFWRHKGEEIWGAYRRKRGWIDSSSRSKQSSEGRYNLRLLHLSNQKEKYSDNSLSEVKGRVKPDGSRFGFNVGRSDGFFKRNLKGRMGIREVVDGAVERMRTVRFGDALGSKSDGSRDTSRKGEQWERMDDSNLTEDFTRTTTSYPPEPFNSSRSFLSSHYPLQEPLSPPPLPTLSHRNPFGTDSNLATFSPFEPSPVQRKGRPGSFVKKSATNPFADYMEHHDVSQLATSLAAKNPFQTPVDGEGEE